MGHSSVHGLCAARHRAAQGLSGGNGEYQMKSPNRLPAEHDRERASQRRQQDSQPAKAANAGSTVALMRTLQRSAGNQAVNAILRRYDQQRRSASSSSAPVLE